MIEQAGDGTDTILAFVSGVKLAAEVENLELGASVANGTGNGLNNSLLGNGVANRLEGGDGDDRLNGSGGNDTLVGGNGTGDVAVYSGVWADYAIAINSDLVTITDLRSGSPDGSDKVTGVELFSFANGTFAGPCSPKMHRLASTMPMLGMRWLKRAARLRDWLAIRLPVATC